MDKSTSMKLASIKHTTQSPTNYISQIQNYRAKIKVLKKMLDDERKEHSNSEFKVITYFDKLMDEQVKNEELKRKVNRLEIENKALRVHIDLLRKELYKLNKIINDNNS